MTTNTYLIPLWRSRIIRKFPLFSLKFTIITGAIGHERAPNSDPNRGLTPIALFPPHCMVMPHLLSLSSSHVLLAPVSRRIWNSDRDVGRGGSEREALSRLSKGRSWWREGTASAVFAPDKSTSRSAFRNVVICVCVYTYVCIYTCARAPAGFACAWPGCTGADYRPSRIEVSEGASDLTMEREAHGPAVGPILAQLELCFSNVGTSAAWIMATFIIPADYADR